ncbi:MAG: hypothetical protein AAF597_21335 [Bacteroidota bacterium]
MKFVLPLLLILASTAVFAQTKTTVVSGFETDNSFVFKVKLDQKRNDDLLATYLKVVNHNVPEEHKTSLEKLNGVVATTTAKGSTVTYNTKRAFLKIEAEKDNEESRAEAELLATLARKELGLQVPDTPTPPTPTSID